MKTPIIVIPTYWKKGPLKEDDSIYDHPTDLLNPEETISKTLQSFKNVQGKFDILIIGIPTRPSIGNEMDDKIQEIVKNLKLPMKTLYFGYKEYNQLRFFLKSEFSSKFSKLCSNRGYGNVRNLCILIPHLLRYNITILIDDDEIVTDRNFVKKATEFIGKKLNGKTLGLVLGLYRNEDGSILLDETKVPWWELVWNKVKIMNEAFKTISQTNANRLIEVSFAFGGNMVIHRDCWVKVPFDPIITRGEDMDYLRNARFMGFDAKLDRSLSIIHIPPKTQTSYIERLRQDIFRFIYTKIKLEKLGIKVEDFDPYPGYFLRHTNGKVLLTELLYFIFHNQNDLIRVENSKELFEALQKMPLVFKETFTFAQSNSNYYIRFQKKWEEFMNQLPSDIPFEVAMKI
ncbi:MAG: hypothetical protein ACTSPV_07015 [Candidatus Hodarchaeales archaeon]